MIFFFLVFIVLIIISLITENKYLILSEDIYDDVTEFFKLFNVFYKILLIPLMIVLSNFIIFYIILITFFFTMLNFLKFINFYFFKKNFFLYNFNFYDSYFFKNHFISENKKSILIFLNEIFLEYPKMISYNLFYNILYYLKNKNKKKIDFNFLKKIVFIRIFKLVFFLPFKCLNITTNVINIFYKNWFLEGLQKKSFYNFLSYSLLDVYVYYVNDLKYISEKRKIFFENGKIKLNGPALSKEVGKKSVESIIKNMEKTSRNYVNKGSFRSFGAQVRSKVVFHAGILFKKSDDNSVLYSNTTTKKFLNVLNKNGDEVKLENGYVNKGTYDTNICNERLTQIIWNESDLKSVPLDKESINNFINNPGRIIQMRSNLIESLFKPVVIEKKLEKTNNIILQKNSETLLDKIILDKSKKTDELKKLEEAAKNLKDLQNDLKINLNDLDENVCMKIANLDFESLKDHFDIFL